MIDCFFLNQMIDIQNKITFFKIKFDHYIAINKDNFTVHFKNKLWLKTNLNSDIITNIKLKIKKHKCIKQMKAAQQIDKYFKCNLNVVYHVNNLYYVRCPHICIPQT